MSKVRVDRLEDLNGDNGILVSDLNKVTESALRVLKPALTFPTVRDNGSPLQVGDIITNLTDGFEYKYTGTGWVSSDVASLIKDLSDPTKVANIVARASVVFDDVQTPSAMLGWNVGKVFRTRGYSSIGDGGGNTYIVVSNSTGTVDGGSIIQGNGVRFKGIFPKNIAYPAQWGAKGDKITDDRTALLNGLVYVMSNSMKYDLSNKEYLILTGISVNAPANARFSIIGSGMGTSNIICRDINTPLLQITGDVSLPMRVRFDGFSTQRETRGVLNGQKNIYLSNLVDFSINDFETKFSRGFSLQLAYAKRGSIQRSKIHSSFLETGTVVVGTANTVTLGSGANSTTNSYNNVNINIVSGTGSGQTRVVTAYNGSTKIVTINSPWSTIPDATSVYELHGGTDGIHLYRGCEDIDISSNVLFDLGDDAISSNGSEVGGSNKRINIHHNFIRNCHGIKIFCGNEDINVNFNQITKALYGVQISAGESPAGTAFDMLDISITDNTFKDITRGGGDQGSVHLYLNQGSGTMSASRISINRNKTYNSKNGIYVTGTATKMSDDLTILDNELYDCSSHGIYLDYIKGSLVCDRNVIKRAGQSGITLETHIDALMVASFLFNKVEGYSLNLSDGFNAIWLRGNPFRIELTNNKTIGGNGMSTRKAIEMGNVTNSAKHLVDRNYGIGGINMNGGGGIYSPSGGTRFIELSVT